MEEVFTTDRLIIREIGMSDMDDMLDLHSDPVVHRYLGNKTITSREVMAEAIASLNRQYVDYGVGRWAIIHKQTKAFIGWTGLEYVTYEVNNHINFYDLGYRLKQQYWGKGYATETARASVQYAFDNLKASEIFAMADIENEGSNKILNRIGFAFVETFDFEGVEHNWYKLEQSTSQNRSNNT